MKYSNERNNSYFIINNSTDFKQRRQNSSCFRRHLAETEDLRLKNT